MNYGPYQLAYSDNLVQEHRGCVVRFGLDGVYLHVNSAHNSVGVESVTVNSNGELEVLTDQQPGSPIVDVQATVDETLAQKGIYAAGPSGGSPITRFSMYIYLSNGVRKKLDLSDPDDYDMIKSEYANVWLHWTSLRPAQER